jgi:hypothetical protein
MDRLPSVNIDRILSLTGIAISIGLFVVPRTATAVACGLFVLFFVLLHPVLTIAAVLRLRAWVAVVLLLAVIALFGNQIRRSEERSPTASDIAREVANSLRTARGIARITTAAASNITSIHHQKATLQNQPRLPQVSSDRVLWNLTADTPLIRVSTSPGAPSCHSCWSPEVHIEPWQALYINTRYANFGATTARRAWLKLSVPRDLKDGSAILATLGGPNSESVYGAACVLQARGPVTLIPDGADWYPYGAERPLPLPFDQSAATLATRDRIELGDVSPGPAFTSDIVFRFRTFPITLGNLCTSAPDAVENVV